MNSGSSERGPEPPSGVKRGEGDGDSHGNACEGPEWLEVVLYLPPPVFEGFLWKTHL